MIAIKVIESKTLALIEENKILKPDIDVEKIAKNLGLKIIKHDLGSNISGVLFIDKGQGTIGYNGEESNVRKRFTIAHEIGHYILHRSNSELFVDHKEFRAVFRDHNSSTGETTQEREANAFAAALLMPKDFLIRELHSISFDLGDDKTDVIKLLSKKFKVSSQAMAYRMVNLNLF